MNEFQELMSDYSPEKVGTLTKDFLQQEMEQFADCGSCGLCCRACDVPNKELFQIYPWNT